MADARIQEGNAASVEGKLSPAELKRRAKAEKQARRAAQKGEAGETASDPKETAQTPREREARASHATHNVSKQTKQHTAPPQQKKVVSSESVSLPSRRRPSNSGTPTTAVSPGKKERKPVELLSHLYAQPRRRPNEAIPRDVHPMVVSVGLQMSDFTLCGSSARCVAMLIAFKHAIQVYSTPVGTSLARHLTSHYLSPQIDFLKSCRPLSESMGNAIRFLKKRIVEIDPSVDDETAKAAVCEDIDTFIRERVYVTGHAIAQAASKQIKDGAVVLVYAKSSVIEQTLLHAFKSGTKFRVIVADSRPLFEGKSFARSFIRAGVQTEYVPLSGIAQAVRAATVVLLGAHSMLSNGRLQSRIGTAALSMLAYKAGLPVVVCCESLKFSGKVALDSLVQNEVAPPDDLLGSTPGWRDNDNLQPLNLMYDVTPAEYIRMVICEYGSLPPSSVPVVHRLANEGI